jgi:hypothetical protein
MMGMLISHDMFSLIHNLFILNRGKGAAPQLLISIIKPAD